jgi:spore coat polysaccharide biosynthesis protein SpsF (cytidylyltransferase family)
VRAFLAEQPDYASNAVTRTYPRGLDTEVMTFSALERAWHEARQSYQRTHVTPYIYENPEHFRILSVTGKEDHSACRWTVDTPEDLEFVRAVYSHFQSQQFHWSDVMSLLEREPGLAEINRSIEQKALHEG